MPRDPRSRRLGTRIRMPPACAVLVALLGGCGGRAATPSTAAGAHVGPAGLTPTRRLVDLTPAERITLCDWSASLFGGYGTRYYCPSYVYDTYPTQRACLESRAQIAPSCAATVADSVSCAVATHRDLCAGASPTRSPECGGRLLGCAPPPVRHPRRP